MPTWPCTPPPPPFGGGFSRASKLYLECAQRRGVLLTMARAQVKRLLTDPPELCCPISHALMEARLRGKLYTCRWPKGSRQALQLKLQLTSTSLVSASLLQLLHRRQMRHQEVTVDLMSCGDFGIPRFRDSSLEDPVVANDGFTYERSCVEECLKVRAKSPMTGAAIENLEPGWQCRHPSLTVSRDCFNTEKWPTCVSHTEIW